MVSSPSALPYPAEAEDFRKDPHEAYAKYRKLARVIQVGDYAPVFTRYADVSALMSDPRTEQMNLSNSGLGLMPEGELRRIFEYAMLISNNPEHRRRRKPVSRTFALKLIQAWRPRIGEVVAELINEKAEERKMEFLGDIASPLPSRIIAEIIGAPTEDAPYFSSKVYGVSRALGTFDYEELPEIEVAAKALNAYVSDLLEQRRADPQDDFLTDYIRITDESNELNSDEVLMQIVALIIGGSDTTRFGLTAMMSLLLQHPEQWMAVCEDEALVSGAVMESLRFEPPAGSIGRAAVEAFDIDGVAFQPGDYFSLSILSAQRDPEIFENPEQFDIRRTDHPKWSISFGGGAHRCLGEALARAEMEETLKVIAHKLPGLKLVDEPAKPVRSSGLRRISALKLQW